MLQQLYTRTQTLHNVAYFRDLNLQTMQQSLLLIYRLKLIVYHGHYHGIYAHLNNGGQKLAHAGAQKTQQAKKNSSNGKQMQNSTKLIYKQIKTNL